METPRSPSYEVADAFEANELFQQQRLDRRATDRPAHRDAGRANSWTPSAWRPTSRRRRAGAPPPVTAEKVAIAAVMAGCRPDYLPVVLAAVRAMCEPEFGLHGVTASTGGSAPLRGGQRAGAAEASA